MHDSRDRRITRVLPTPQGSELVDSLIQYRNEAVTAILDQLDPDQLDVVEKAFQYLLDAAARREEQQQSNTEAVA